MSLSICLCTSSFLPLSPSPFQLPFSISPSFVCPSLSLFIFQRLAALTMIFTICAQCHKHYYWTPLSLLSSHRLGPFLKRISRFHCKIDCLKSNTNVLVYYNLSSIGFEAKEVSFFADLFSQKGLQWQILMKRSEDMKRSRCHLADWREEDKLEVSWLR